MPRKKCGLTVQRPFPILKLPPEIRNRIWRYSLVKDGDVIILPHGRQGFISKIIPSRLRSGKELQRHQQDDKRRINSTSLALAFVCRQLYLEAALIYYSENTFRFLGDPAIQEMKRQERIGRIIWLTNPDAEFAAYSQPQSLAGIFTYGFIVDSLRF